MYFIKADGILHIKPIGKGGSCGGTFHLQCTVGHFVRYQVNPYTANVENKVS
jgi:hypothetical protein